MAILENNLQQAVLREASGNAAAIVFTVRFLVYFAPAPAHGSSEAVSAWLASDEPVPTPFE